MDNSLTQLMNRAIIIATQAHKDQKDKSGEMYIFHPLRVMLRGQTLEERIVGVLHDVVEDTEVTLDQLAEDFPMAIIVALDAISHRENEPNVEYLRRVVADPLARIVKEYDVDDNSNPVRMARLDEETQVRLNKKYHRAYEFLRGERV